MGEDPSDLEKRAENIGRGRQEGSQVVGQNWNVGKGRTLTIIPFFLSSTLKRHTSDLRLTKRNRFIRSESAPGP